LQTYSEEKRTLHLRNLARGDLYFLIRYLLRRVDVDHPWLFARCREVQADPNGRLDLWAREHYKSTLITWGKTIQDILCSHGDDAPIERPLTFGIFSYNRPTAKRFLAQIKFEIEGNSLLRGLFPDVFWKRPNAEAPHWSLDSGLVVKRDTNPKEPTVGASGLVDGMPTGAHYDVLVYDDVVTLDVVRTEDMRFKVTEALKLSYNLGARGGVKRMIGTRYHFADSYRDVMDAGTFQPRIHAATDDATVEGEPVFLTRDEIAEKRRDQGPYVFSCQQLQIPMVDSSQGFSDAWLRKYRDVNVDKLNTYILVDPANQKHKRSDYTSMWVIGLGEDRNYYALKFFRDRLSLTERAKRLMDLHREFEPLRVGYEQYGMQADIDHLTDMMERESYRFHVEPLGGQLGNVDRVKRLIPVFEQGRMWLPVSHQYTDVEGRTTNQVDVFVEQEYKPFPVGMHADMLDSLSRILDDEMATAFPKKRKTAELVYDNTGVI